MPVAHNKALEEGVTPAAAGEGDSPIRAVLRSKGFMWLSNKHATAFYWSHAGQHFEIREEGDW
jgi:G3E family GTPase